MAASKTRIARYEHILRVELEEVFGGRWESVRRLVAGMSDEVLACRAGNHVFPYRDPGATFEDQRIGGSWVTFAVRPCRNGCGSTVHLAWFRDDFRPYRARRIVATDPGYLDTKGIGAPIPRRAVRAELHLRMEREKKDA